MKLKTLDQVYSVIPTLNCQGKCYESCGIIPLFPVEVEDMKSRGLTPPMHQVPGGQCKALTAEQRCSIYDRRPYICRIWGVTQKLACPFGCKPRRYLSDRECQNLAVALNRLSEGKEPVVLAEESPLLLPHQNEDPLILF